jgi:predicted transcriptional regulator
LPSKRATVRLMIEPDQIRAARALLNWGQQKLADKAKLSRTAIHNIEGNLSDPKASTLRAIQRALEAAGVVFLPRDETGGAGVRWGKGR